jgi:hypothetical protein
VDVLVMRQGPSFAAGGTFAIVDFDTAVWGIGFNLTTDQAHASLLCYHYPRRLLTAFVYCTALRTTVNCAGDRFVARDVLDVVGGRRD